MSGPDLALIALFAVIGTIDVLCYRDYRRTMRDMDRRNADDKAAREPREPV